MRMFARHIITAVILTAVPLVPGTGVADEPHPAPPATPLQTRPGEDRGAWLLKGWEKTESGTSGQGKTILAVEGEADYRVTLRIDGEDRQQVHPASFELPDADHNLTIMVDDPRGSRWEGTVEVPRGMRVTVALKAIYEHRGYLGTVKNDTLACRNKAKRKRLRFDILQNQAPVSPEIILDAGKSAPGVRLKVGAYDIIVSEFAHGDWREMERLPLKVDGPNWRVDYVCAP
jgi:hypothetical protein